MAATSAAAHRRTQASRREASRARILQATLDCLADEGYAGTSLPAILRRARLSNGGLWRHFRSKAELLAAALLYSEEQLAAAVEASPPAESDRIEAAADRLWDYLHQAPGQALIELIFASRHDEDLREALSRSDRDAGEIFFRVLAVLVGPVAAEHPDFRRRGRALALALYGSSLTAGLRNQQSDEGLRAEFRLLARDLFEQ